MPTERETFAAANLSNKFVIASGGQGSENAQNVGLKSVDRYNISSNAWE